LHHVLKVVNKRFELVVRISWWKAELSDEAVNLVYHKANFQAIAGGKTRMPACAAHDPLSGVDNEQATVTRAHRSSGFVDEVGVSRGVVHGEGELLATSVGQEERHDGSLDGNKAIELVDAGISVAHLELASAAATVDDVHALDTEIKE
jgi:hypothetical protein